MITSKKNELIKEIKMLNETKNRLQKGLFIVHGDKFIKDISLKGISAKFLLSIIEEDSKSYLCDKFIHVSEDIIEYISDVKSPQKMIGVYQIPKYDYDEFLNKQRILLLDNIQNPENVGALIRNANCTGFDGIILYGSCADPYSSKSITASAGSCIDTSIIKLELEEINDLKNSKFMLIGSSLKANELPYEIKNKYILALSNEGNGIDNKLEKICDKLIKLNMKGNCESYNVACAGALLMYITGGLI